MIILTFRLKRKMKQISHYFRKLISLAMVYLVLRNHFLLFFSCKNLVIICILINEKIFNLYERINSIT